MSVLFRAARGLLALHEQGVAHGRMGAGMILVGASPSGLVDVRLSGMVVAGITDADDAGGLEADMVAMMGIVRRALCLVRVAEDESRAKREARRRRRELKQLNWGVRPVPAAVAPDPVDVCQAAAAVQLVGHLGAMCENAVHSNGDAGLVPSASALLGALATARGLDPSASFLAHLIHHREWDAALALASGDPTDQVGEGVVIYARAPHRFRVMRVNFNHNTHAQGLFPTTTERAGYTPLHVVAMTARDAGPAVRSLIEALVAALGVDLEAPAGARAVEERTTRAVKLAFERDRPDLVGLFLDAGASVAGLGDQPVGDAVRLGSVAMIRTLLDRGLDPNGGTIPAEAGDRPPLFLAAYFGDAQLCQAGFIFFFFRFSAVLFA